MNWFIDAQPIARLSVRIVAASVAAYLLCGSLSLHQSQWSVFSAILVTQTSVGASLQAMSDRLIGSIGGGFWGAVVAMLAPPHLPAIGMALALAFAVTPLALLAAWKTGYRVAPVTAAFVLLSPTIQGRPWALCAERILAIGLGSLVALAVSLLVLPTRASAAMAVEAAEALDGMAELVAALAKGLRDEAPPAALQVAQDKVRIALGRAEVAAVEMKQERAAYLSKGVDPEPICRTLRRLRYDLSMIVRAAYPALPEQVSILADAATGLGAELAAYLHAAGVALMRAEPAPNHGEVDGGFALVAMAMAKMRVSGATRNLPDDAASRVFGLGFAWEQMQRDLEDLADRINEVAAPPSARGPRGRFTWLERPV